MVKKWLLYLPGHMECACIGMNRVGMIMQFRDQIFLKPSYKFYSDLIKK